MRVEDIIEPIRQRRLELEGQIRNLEEEFRAAKEPLTEELKVCARLLRAAEPPAPSTPKPVKQSGGARTYPVGYPAAGTKAATVTNALLNVMMEKDTSEHFRTVDLRAEAGLEERNESSHAARAMDIFRRDGIIRFVRKEGNSIYYARTADEAPAELLEAIGAND